MKGMSNEDSGLFPKKYMDKPVTEKDVIDVQKKLSETPIPNWSEVVDKCVEIAKKFVKDSAIESIDIRLTNKGVALNFNYKEKK
jgi:CO dehydrogenase/acetyl-CoA synthase delta subunit